MKAEIVPSASSRITAMFLIEYSTWPRARAVCFCKNSLTGRSGTGLISSKRSIADGFLDPYNNLRRALIFERSTFSSSIRLKYSVEAISSPPRIELSG